MPLPMKEGDVLTVEFTLDGPAYTGLIGGPQCQFDESASFQSPFQWPPSHKIGERDRCGEAILTSTGLAQISDTPGRATTPSSRRSKRDNLRGWARAGPRYRPAMPVVNMCADLSMWVERASESSGRHSPEWRPFPTAAHPTNHQTPANRDALQLQPVPKDV